MSAGLELYHRFPTLFHCFFLIRYPYLHFSVLFYKLRGKIEIVVQLLK